MGDDHGEEIDRKIGGKENHLDKKSANKDTDEAHFQKVQCLHLRNTIIRANVSQP